MSIHNHLVLDQLSRQLSFPSADGDHQLRKAGAFHALDNDSEFPPSNSRRQTLVILQNQFLILVDDFSTAKPTLFSLTLSSNQSLAGTRRRLLTNTDSGMLAVHPFGDYRTTANNNDVIWSQELAQGRFLIAVTRDADADVRVLDGWAVEIRSQGMIYHVLHSNRSKRLRPLGPMQTDARFAMVEWPENAEVQTLPPFSTRFSVLQATKIKWGDKHEMSADTSFDVNYTG